LGGRGEGEVLQDQSTALGVVIENSGRKKIIMKNV